jgi:YacP-like NYN domain-containing protein
MGTSGRNLLSHRLFSGGGGRSAAPFPPVQNRSVTDAAVVLVDARNVLRSQWPNIPDEELVRLCCEWAERNGMYAVVAFDGRAPVRPDSAHCTVVGTEHESADDWLMRKAEELRGAGSRFWLVTSDRALRDVAGQGAERTIGGGGFANELRGSSPRRSNSRRLDRSVQTKARAKPTPPEDGTASGAS